MTNLFRKNKSLQRGSAMALVLVFMTAILLLGTALLASAQSGTTQTMAVLKAESHFYAAESAAQLATQMFAEEMKTKYKQLYVDKGAEINSIEAAKTKIEERINNVFNEIAKSLKDKEFNGEKTELTLKIESSGSDSGMMEARDGTLVAYCWSNPKFVVTAKTALSTVETEIIYYTKLEVTDGTTTKTVYNEFDGASYYKKNNGGMYEETAYDDEDNEYTLSGDQKEDKYNEIINAFSGSGGFLDKAKAMRKENVLGYTKLTRDVVSKDGIVLVEENVSKYIDDESLDSKVAEYIQTYIEDHYEEYCTPFDEFFDNGYGKNPEGLTGEAYNTYIAQEQHRANEDYSDYKDSIKASIKGNDDFREDITDALITEVGYSNDNREWKANAAGVYLVETTGNLNLSQTDVDVEYLYVKGDLTISGNINREKLKGVYVTGSIIVQDKTEYNKGIIEYKDAEGNGKESDTNFLVEKNMSVSMSNGSFAHLYNCRFFVRDTMSIAITNGGSYNFYSNCMFVAFGDKGTININTGTASNCVTGAGEKYVPQFYSSFAMTLGIQGSSTRFYGIYATTATTNIITGSPSEVPLSGLIVGLMNVDSNPKKNPTMNPLNSEQIENLMSGGLIDDMVELRVVGEDKDPVVDLRILGKSDLFIHEVQGK